jgi:enamine deaminase RidA (YjgF/YER057c/UK114 family)
MTNGANNGVINNPVVTEAGDDGISVVSYLADRAICHDITVNSPTINGTTWGRGLSVVGGHDITYNNINVNNTNAGGVYIAAEGDPYYTNTSYNIHVTGGTITGANYNPAVVHGAVIVYSGNTGQGVANVSISGLTITATSQTAQRNVAIVVDAGSVTNISLTNIALVNTTLPPFIHTKNVDGRNYTTSSWTLNGKPITV